MNNFQFFLIQLKKFESDCGEIAYQFDPFLPDFIRTEVNLSKPRSRPNYGLDDYDTVENLIGALWYGKPSEIFEPIPKESWDQIASDYPVIEKIGGTSMGGVWDEFWIFYEPWVIDNDNQISIYLIFSKTLFISLKIFTNFSL